MRDMMSVLLEGALDEELDEELGHSKYDYRNKDTGNSRNGHSKKTMPISYGDVDVAILRDHNGEYEPQIIKKYQNTVTQAMEAAYLQTEIQKRIIRKIRNSTKFVSYKDIKKLMADLKRVYAAPTEETALNELGGCSKTNEMPNTLRTISRGTIIGQRCPLTSSIRKRSGGSFTPRTP